MIVCQYFYLQILRDIRQGLLQLSRDGRTGEFYSNKTDIISILSVNFGDFHLHENDKNQQPIQQSWLVLQNTWCVSITMPLLWIQ